MGECIFHGNGENLLNFKVVGGTTQPTNPRENTIWINTDTGITSWTFSAEEPKNLSSGMVWFRIGASGSAAFNALKRNNIQVYPLSAKQYVDNSLTEKRAKIYKNGAWVDFIDEYILIPGSGAFDGVYGVTKNADGSCYFYAKHGGDMVIPIDVTNYKTMTIKGSYPTFKGKVCAGLFSAGNISAFVAGHVNEFADGGSTIDGSYDISYLNGSVYFGVCGVQNHEEVQTLACTLTEVIFKP